MKLTIKANEKITDAKIIKHSTDNSTIYALEIDFIPSFLWSDLEIWLEDESGKWCDYAKMNLSTRNKMKFSK